MSAERGVRSRRLLAVGLVLNLGVGVLPFAASSTAARTVTGRYCHAEDPTTCVTVWQDDFDGPAGGRPEPAVWRFDVGGGGWGNGELQTYTDRAENAALSGEGTLEITARRRVDDDGTVSFTSARMTSRGLGSFTYGRLTARIRLPEGHGVWPAMWLLGDDIVTAGYPESGEIDVLETPDTARTVHVSVHGPTEEPATGPKWQVGTSTTFPQSLAGTWHEYALTRSPGHLLVAIDGRTVATLSRGDLTEGQRWVFDKPFHVVLNVAVGGYFASAPTDETAFPATMAVDWIRLEERS